MTCHFQRGVEGVHVDVQHRAAGLVMPPIAFGGGQSRCGAHIPYRTVPGWDGAGLAVPVGERPSQSLCRPRVAWPVGVQGAAKLLALLLIVAGIVTFTGDSNPAR